METQVIETPKSEENKSEIISALIESLNALPKGERSLKGRPIRNKLRKMGFYLSKQEKV